MRNHLLVIGVDGLGYDSLKVHLGQHMPFTYWLSTARTCCRIKLKMAVSPRNWTLIFSGRDLKWYTLYIKRVHGDRWRLIKRWELPVVFIWDEFPDMVVINAPVVIPPVCKNTGFKPIAYGLGYTVFEWLKEINDIRYYALKAVESNSDVIAVFTVIDRMLHITANEKVIRRVCVELDEVIRQLVATAEKKKYKWIIISDHGMRRISPDIQGNIAPRHDMPFIRTVTKAIHGHSDNALYISNTGIHVKSLQDVYRIMRRILLQ